MHRLWLFGNGYKEKFMSIEEEKKFFMSEINEYKFHNDRFKIFVESDKYIGGFLSSKNNKDHPLNIINNCRAVYLSILDFYSAIKFSIENALVYSYDENVNSFEKFKMFGDGYSSQEELFAYYFLNNAIYRLSSLWDFLAQFYNSLYGLINDNRKIYYEAFFNSYKDNYAEFKQISNYLSELIDSNESSEPYRKWSGNHKYLKNYRNKMTHINSPSITTISNYDFNIKDHPLVILKRLCDEFNTLCSFIDTAVSIANSKFLKMNL